MAQTLALGLSQSNILLPAFQPHIIPKSSEAFRIAERRSAVFESSITGGVQKLVPISARYVCSLKSRDKENDEFVQDLRVPEEWMLPSSALQESEWLGINLKKWLDDEYCPEIANEEISKRCAKVYYYCLMEKQADLGEILMQMVRNLETFSFKESFHGAFSASNAAVHLITMRIQATEETQKREH